MNFLGDLGDIEPINIFFLNIKGILHKFNQVMQNFTIYKLIIEYKLIIQYSRKMQLSLVPEISSS